MYFLYTTSYTTTTVYVVVRLGVVEKKLDVVLGVLLSFCRGNAVCSYLELRKRFMSKTGLISRYAFDNWVIYCIAEGYVEPLDGARETGNSVVYKVFVDVVRCKLKKLGYGLL